LKSFKTEGKNVSDAPSVGDELQCSWDNEYFPARIISISLEPIVDAVQTPRVSIEFSKLILRGRERQQKQAKQNE